MCPDHRGRLEIFTVRNVKETRIKYNLLFSFRNHVCIDKKTRFLIVDFCHNDKQK